MSPPGADDLLVGARSALLDALAALDAHRNSLVLVGAQAIYLHTGGVEIALAEATKDSDLAVDPRSLGDTPLLDQAMEDGHFHRDLTNPQPGSWLSPTGIPVDLLVPEALAPGTGSRSVDIPPHDRGSTRRTLGLEAALVDNAPMKIQSLAPGDERTVVIRVAGTAALLVAKLHKLGERAKDAPHRLVDKDAHDIYRLLVATDTGELAARLAKLRDDDLAGDVTHRAIVYLDELFGTGPGSLGAVMAGRAEELVGDPAVVAAATAALAMDLLELLRT